MAACLLIALAGCVEVGRFLVPPPQFKPRDRGVANAVDGVIEGVALAEGATPVQVAIRAGRVVEVAAEIPASRRSPSTRSIEGHGALLSPAYADAHIHLAGSAMLADAIFARDGDIAPDGALSRRLVDEVRTRTAGLGDGDWLWLVGVAPAGFAALDAAVLERQLPTARLYISAPDGHGGVVSTSAAALLPAPLADAVASGRGRVHGELARRVWRGLPPPRRQRLKPLMVGVLRELADQGIGEAHAMGESVATFAALRELDTAGRLPIRVRVYLDALDPATAALVAAPRPSAAAVRPPLVTLEGVKIWLDGTLGGRSAAMSRPYADAVDAGQVSLPQPNYAAREVASWLERLDRVGMQLAVHAIGDAAIDRVVEAVRGFGRPDGARPLRIEHAQVVRPDQLSELRGMLCSIQPLHRGDDEAFAAQRLGPERAGWAYRAGTLAPHCPLLLGSDLPIGRASPRDLLDELVAGPGRLPHERLSRTDALAAMVRSPIDGRPRTIAVGAPADFIALAPAAAGESTLVWLMVDGRITRNGSSTRP